MIPRLHEVLTLERPMLGLDLETTGVDPRTSGIVELGLEIMAPNHPVREYRTLVNPMMPIPAGATKVHGITNEMVKDAPTFVQLADNLLKGFVGCDFAGYNVRFDLGMLASEFARAAKDWSYADARILDGFRLWQIAEGRTLTHAIERWLKPQLTDQEIYDELDQEGQAHNALWDTKMATRVLAAQLKKCPTLPRDIQQLHDLCWPDWFDHEGKLRYNKQGELALSFGEHKDKPLRMVPKTYFTWMIGKNFNETVKAVCRAAVNGEFPVARV